MSIFLWSHTNPYTREIYFETGGNQKHILNIKNSQRCDVSPF